MSLLTRVLTRLWKLPPATHRDIAVETLRVPMRDGVELLADRYYSRSQASLQPAVLIRSCYSRTMPKMFAGLFAERGMQVVVQSCRGTAGSQGVFRPFFDEQNDGEDTVEWMARQPWFNGDLALWGISYLGNTAWAIANSKAAHRVKALGLHVTLTNFRDRTYAFGGYTLETCTGWTLTMLTILRTGGMNLAAALLSGRKNRALGNQANRVIPLRKADRELTPEGVSWWQDWMDHAEPGDPWWDPVDYGRAAQTIPPTAMVSGWYDIFLPWQLHDFMAAQRAGREIRITIGPWTHAAMPGASESLRQSIQLFREQFRLQPKAADSAAPVRLFVMGAQEWRSFASWPPPNSSARKFFLRSNGEMSASVPDAEGESAFDYDPAHPTPSFFGPSMESKGSGDMAELEKRSDVLVFTSKAFDTSLDAIGPVSAEIFVRSNTAHSDLYLCLCDLDPNLRSRNVCDGYTRLGPDSGEMQPDSDGQSTRKVKVEFWPTAYRFELGHRLRIIVAGGAHPRYSRNLGSGESLGDAHTVVVAHQKILHGPAHASSIELTVCKG